MAQAFHIVAWDTVAAVSANIAGAPLNQLIGAAKIAVEMEQLLRSRPMSIKAEERLPPSIDLSRLNPAQLGAFRELLDAARTPGPAELGTSGGADTDPTDTGG